MFRPISEGEFGYTRVSAMVLLGGEPRNTTFRNLNAPQPWFEDPVSVALLDTEKFIRNGNIDEGSICTSEPLTERVTTNLDQASVLPPPSTGSFMNSEVPFETPPSSKSIRSLKQGRRGLNQHHTRRVRRFLVVAKELRFTAEHPREEVFAHIQRHVLRWSSLSVHSPLLLRYLRMEYIGVNEVEPLFLPNGDLLSHNRSGVCPTGAKRMKKKGDIGLLFNDNVSQEGMGSKRQGSSLTDTACPTSREVAGLRIYLELARHGTLHTFQTREMPSLFGRSYLHELTARVYMRDVLLGLFFLHENGELQYDLSARGIFLNEPICSVYKTYFPAYISEVPVGDLTRVPPIKFGRVLKLLNPNPSRLQELQRDPSASFDTTTPAGSFHEGQGSNLCDPVRSNNSKGNKSSGVTGNKLVNSRSGVRLVPRTSSMTIAHQNASKSVGFDFSKSSTFIKRNRINSNIGSKGCNSGITGSIKANGSHKNGMPTKKSVLSTSGLAPALNESDGNAGMRLNGRVPRFPPSRGQTIRCWDSLAFSQIEQTYGFEESRLPLPCLCGATGSQTRRRPWMSAMGHGTHSCRRSSVVVRAQMASPQQAWFAARTSHPRGSGGP
ncbi:unnamed protein product [Phytomonas sp. EM1]|nr:unnamed protein product [Phytomonas sp. EM1]|eukprot:CCW65093.1 unnamed protein product [Phytomonas sp. isolate EM1]